MPTDARSFEADPADLRQVSGFGYRPALDGIRALAVLLVIAFHLGSAFRFRQLGGWLGVDAFFVLSGFLITSLLLVERSRSGRISMRNFYVRRLLRLAPLSIAMVAVIWCAATFAPGVTGLRLTSFGALSILAYFSNWTYIHRPVELGTASHYWSLSIEEQFYLLWPTVVIGSAFIFRRRIKSALTGGLSLILLIWWYNRRHLWRASFDQGRDAGRIWNEFAASTFQRPDGLLVGCLLAVVLFDWQPTARWRRVIGAGAIASAVAVVAILSQADITATTLTIGNFIPQWGLVLFNLSVAGVIAWCMVAPTSIATRLLAWPPLVWIGRRAYGIYLFHPVVLGVVMAHSSSGRVTMSFATVVITFALAAASFRWFETPFLRRKQRFSADSTTLPSSDSSPPLH